MKVLNGRQLFAAGTSFIALTGMACGRPNSTATPPSTTRGPSTSSTETVSLTEPEVADTCRALLENWNHMKQQAGLYRFAYGKVGAKEKTRTFQPNDTLFKQIPNGDPFEYATTSKAAQAQLMRHAQEVISLADGIGHMSPQTADRVLARNDAIYKGAGHAFRFLSHMQKITREVLAETDVRQQLNASERADLEKSSSTLNGILPKLKRLLTKAAASRASRDSEIF